MRAFGFLVGLVVSTLGLLVTSSPVLGQNWRPALHDADELYDAAEDLHDRAERFQDPHVLPVTANLEQLTAQLYQRLKNRACANEVVPLFNATECALNDAIEVVTLSCQMRTDRKSLSEIANARKYFGCVAEHIQCALREIQPVYHARTPVNQWPNGIPGYSAPQYSAPRYGVPQYSVPQYSAPEYSQPEYGVPQASPYPNRGVTPWSVGPNNEYEVRRSSQSSPGRALARVLISELLR